MKNVEECLKFVQSSIVHYYHLNFTQFKKPKFDSTYPISLVIEISVYFTVASIRTSQK